METKPQQFITEREAAQFLAVTPRTLQHWRMTRKWPAWLKICGLVRYTPRDLEKFLEASKQTPQNGGAQ